MARWWLSLYGFLTPLRFQSQATPHHKVTISSQGSKEKALAVPLHRRILATNMCVFNAGGKAKRGYWEVTIQKKGDQELVRKENLFGICCSIGCLNCLFLFFQPSSMGVPFYWLIYQRTWSTWEFGIPQKTSGELYSFGASKTKTEFVERHRSIHHTEQTIFVLHSFVLKGSGDV